MTTNQNWNRRRLSSTGKILLGNIIPALKNLKAGDTLLIRDSSPHRVKQIRSHLYTHFSETGQTRYFKTVRESANTLRIICRDLTLSVITAELNPVETFVRDNLLECETFNDAQLIAHKAYTEGTLTDEELLSVMEEWETKIGGVTFTKIQEPSTSIDPFNGIIEKGEKNG